MGNEKPITKVFFPLDIEEEGWPPISIEILNGEIRKDGNIKIDNTPFFVWGVALGDIISVRKNEKGNYYFDNIILESGNRAIAIIFREKSFAEEIYQFLKSKGCFCEYGEFGATQMLAVSIDLNQDYGAIRDYLESLEKKEVLSYAELCIN